MNPLIEPHPDAPLGAVEILASYTPQDFTPDSCILCRNTAPLVPFAYSLLQNDIPCTILGKDIGKSLSDLVRKMRSSSLEDLTDKLGVWRDREWNKAVKEDRNPERVDDQYNCLLFFISSLDEDSRTVASLLAKIELLFSDEVSSSRVTLSTIHKAKGLEFTTVFLLDRNLLPSRYAKAPEQLKQERNLHYVAVTRAKLVVNYIQSGCWKET